MANVKKLVEKMLRLPPEMRFTEVTSVLKSFGWMLEKSTPGSHFVYGKAGFPSITIPKKHKKVKRIYIGRIIARLELEEWYEQNKK
jgi:predicted RNA binding protein YcfA (HicA-like mRNA interferase family)